MSDDNNRLDRRSVLRATGAALGAGGLLAASGPAAAERLCLANDTTVFEDCPPTRFGPTVQAGSEAFAHLGCTVNGTQYYYVADPEADGYVRRWALTTC